MKHVKSVLLSFLLPLSAFAFSADQNPALIGVQTGNSHPAPAELNLDSYTAWAQPILQPKSGADYTSAFTSLVFDWYEREKDSPLPPDVAQDPQHIFVNVQGPENETIQLEQSGDIEEGNTVGAEVYAEMDGTVAQALEAMLYRWGKPVGQKDGFTYPPGDTFSRRIEYFAPNADWGAQAFASLSLRKDGGVVHDLADRYLMLVRGDDKHGYDVFMQYIGPAGTTDSKECFAIAIIRPTSPGKVSYKLSTRFQGQSYKVLGNVTVGRAQIGFNSAKDREIQLEYMAELKELQASGAIADHKTDISWGGK
jgi:hypothetical protein